MILIYEEIQNDVTRNLETRTASAMAFKVPYKPTRTVQAGSDPVQEQASDRNRSVQICRSRGYLKCNYRHDNQEM